MNHSQVGVNAPRWMLPSTAAVRRAGAGWRADTAASAVPLPADEEAEEAAEEEARDIRNQQPGPTWQLTPMVLNLDTLEESTLEVSRRERGRASLAFKQPHVTI
jgi:hypothetical protein